MPDRFTAIAFDLDKDSLASLCEALPGWEMKAVNQATAASLSQDWNPGAADLLVVKAREEPADTLGLCRFLAFCSVFSTDFPKVLTKTAGPRGRRRHQAQRADAPLLVLVPPGQDRLVRAALKAGADGCLVLPLQTKEMVSMVARVRRANQVRAAHAS